jgi:hypothetical protein
MKAMKRFWTALGSVYCGAVIGCWSVPSAHTANHDYSYRRENDQAIIAAGGAQFDDCVSGGQLFKMYCGTCHNARPLTERPFSNTEVAFAHMREQAYLTGEEYRQLIHFLRRASDIGPPSPAAEPSPKRFFYSQPISEMRPEN